MDYNQLDKAMEQVERLIPIVKKAVIERSQMTDEAKEWVEADIIEEDKIMAAILNEIEQACTVPGIVKNLEYLKEEVEAAIEAAKKVIRDNE